ncbi:CDP-diacylglycerol--glycerol-3-phosphate 3-phosphatidyltransferase [Ruminococcaceae bacterium OttesenSCG-928-D13]|nr:CDP-diacylglycerol--glycerol-3-phosphate 3-phosphatidyltransferase [Ruminococcaceae bacterium OttesenSCG-928-D13]
MNTPNKLTMLRILMIPVFIVFASMEQIPYNYLIAAVIFSVASFTDFLDGHIARKQGIVTDFGKFADPLADKLLTTTAFIYMLMDGVCHPLVLVIILAREFAVSGVRMVAAGAPGGKVIAANIWGKVKTVVQMVTIILYYFLMGFGQLWPAFGAASAQLCGLAAFWLCWAVAAITAISGVQYIWSNRQYINTAK